jgi:protease-4
MQSFSHDTPTILNINVNGLIGLEGHNKKEDIVTQLIESQDGDLKAGQVKGIMLTINSTGGLADESDAIYRYLTAYKKRYNVPIRVYIDGICASGGMYIACAGDKIFASEDSLIGHVGVLLSPPFFNFSKVMDKLGVQSLTLYAGKHKDSMNPFRPWEPGEEQNFVNILDFMYKRFVTIVSESRPKLTKEVLTNEGAQIYPSPKAEELGYIDGQTSTIEETLRAFATELGVQDNYQYLSLETHDFFEELFGARAQALFGSRELQIRIPGLLPQEACGKPLYLYCPQ